MRDLGFGTVTEAAPLLVRFKGVSCDLMTTFQHVNVVGQEVTRGFFPSDGSSGNDQAKGSSTGYISAPRFSLPAPWQEYTHAISFGPIPRSDCPVRRFYATRSDTFRGARRTVFPVARICSLCRRNFQCHDQIRPLNLYKTRDGRIRAL